MTRGSVSGKNTLRTDHFHNYFSCLTDNFPHDGQKDYVRFKSDLKQALENESCRKLQLKYEPWETCEELFMLGATKTQLHVVHQRGQLQLALAACWRSACAPLGPPELRPVSTQCFALQSGMENALWIWGNQIQQNVKLRLQQSDNFFFSWIYSFGDRKFSN